MARKALGKGLRALIPEAPLPRTLIPEDEQSRESQQEQPPPPDGSMDAPPEGEPDEIRTRENLRYIPVGSIVPNPRQPRSDWDSSNLEQLARSISEKGLLEPIIVRPRWGKFEIVAGERRWRACKIIGWEEIPAIVRPLDDHESLEAALIENLQRSDLSPVDEARAYQALMSEFGLTHEEVARRVVKDRSTVSNLLRILRLPEQILHHVSRGTLSAGHARVLVGLPPEAQAPLAARIVEESWSVRQAEEWAAKMARRRGAAQSGQRTRGPRKSEHLQRVEEEMVRHFATEVRVRVGRKGGRVEIHYHDDDELSRLLDMFGVVIV